MFLIRLGKELIFPPHHYADENDGILAIGGDLSPARLVLAYKNGIFPWYNPGEPILWHSPKERFVLLPTELKISKSMKKILRENTFSFTENKNFKEVISRCGSIKRKGQSGTWITNEMKEAYLNLHQLGIAKSVEVWQGEELVGGFYGIDLGEIFCGESMFSSVPNASKFGFISFVEKYKSTYKLIDCQTPTEHLASLGAKKIPRKEFLNYLEVGKY